MSIYLYAPKLTPGTKELMVALGATRLTGFDGMRFWHRGALRSFTPKDVIICWGATLPRLDSMTILNAHDNDLLNTPTSIVDFLSQGSIYDVYLIKPLELVSKPIDIYKTPFESLTSDYKYILSPDYPGRYVTRLKMSAEFEFHICNSEILQVRRKETDKRIAKTHEDWLRNPDAFAHPWFRNPSTGWIPRKYTLATERDLHLKAQVMRLYEATGLTFCTLYMGCLSDGDYSSPILRKIISNPALNTEDVKLYADHLMRVLADNKKKKTKEILEHGPILEDIPF
jgi:hypothetical protein